MGSLLLDYHGEGGRFFDDEQVDTEGFGGELGFTLEGEGVEKRFKFELHSLDESGMPGDRRSICHEGPPVYIEGRSCRALEFWGEFLKNLVPAPIRIGANTILT
jgi:hypothetical protein